MSKPAHNWAHQFKIVYDIFSSICAASGTKASKSALERLLGCSRGKATHWQDGQRPSVDDMLAMSQKLGITLEWLRTGEGSPTEPRGADPVDNRRAALKPVPMVGLASCGVEGWNKPMSIAVNASPIVLGDNTVAVVAAGESMVPAGIASGQLCYCDPDQPVLAGDAVYIVRRDNMATIKLYLGEGERAGWIRLQGWLDPDTIGLRKPFYVDLLESEIVLIAPVIYERRRL